MPARAEPRAGAFASSTQTAPQPRSAAGPADPGWHRRSRCCSIPGGPGTSSPGWYQCPAPYAALPCSSRLKLFGTAWIKRSGVLTIFLFFPPFLPLFLFFLFFPPFFLLYDPSQTHSQNKTKPPSVSAHTVLLRFHHLRSASLLSSSSHSQTLCCGSSAVCTAISLCHSLWRELVPRAGELVVAGR